MINNRINELKKLMSAENISVYIVNSSDYNASAYVGEYFKTRQFMTGFSGSNGTLIVTPSSAVLYTDSRYYIQAENQLKGSMIELYKADEKETVPMLEYILENVPYGGKVGADGRTLSASFAEKLESGLSKKCAKLVSNTDLVSLIWTDNRPQMPSEKIQLHGVEYSGMGADEKINWLREEMKKRNADIHLITELDDIAWLLNIRGNDIHCVPVVISYLLITQNDLLFFVDEIKLTDEVRAYFLSLNITLMPYDSIYSFLEKFRDNEKNMLLNSKTVNYSLYKAAKGVFSVIDAINPTTLKKAVKNETEAKNAIKARVLDGKAVCEFLAYIKKNVKSGNITEISAARKLFEYRKAVGAVGESFDTICGYAEHGAIVHYTADENTDVVIKNKGLLLLDSGGQYKEGTTDVTRTIVLGELTPFEKKCYTLVLMGMLRVLNTRFKKGTKGCIFDEIARKPLMEHGLNYGHSTGHGVGSFLSVHEGPNGFSKRNETEIEVGMITTDEPGCYIEGEFGVRIENELICVKDNEGLCFESLTMVPIDKEGIDFELMTDEDTVFLNQYHKKVRETILPIISDEAREYLIEATKEI